jgi:hypothetical protein
MNPQVVNDLIALFSGVAAPLAIIQEFNSAFCSHAAIVAERAVPFRLSTVLAYTQSVIRYFRD